MPYSSLQEIVDDINLRIVTNDNQEIEGEELRAILIGMCQFIVPSLQQELIVRQGAGGAVGGSNDNETFTTGTSLETVIRDILIKAVHPIYIAPNLTLQTNNSVFTIESGTTMVCIFTTIFNQNDGGSIITRLLRRNVTSIGSSFPYNESIQIGDESIAYQAAYSYNNGSTKNNNLDQPDPIGKILAGTIYSNIITYKGVRKVFKGTTATTPTTSSEVRALDAVLDAKVDLEFTINIAIGAAKVVFAYPSSLRNPLSVKYLELSNSEIKELFEVSLVNVQGAEGFAAIEYKVFTFTPVEPFTTSATYKVTI